MTDADAILGRRRFWNATHEQRVAYLRAIIAETDQRIVQWRASGRVADRAIAIEQRCVDDWRMMLRQIENDPQWRPANAPPRKKAVRTPDTKEDVHMKDSSEARNLGRMHNDANIDIADLPAVVAAVKSAHEIGHWRRVLAIYGDHLPTCAVRVGASVCDCGWSEAYGP